MLRGEASIAGTSPSEDDVAAAAAGLGTDFDDVVGGADHGLVVFDDDDRVARVGERADDADQAVDIAWVQADRRLVEDEERVDERGAETGSEVDAFHFAAGERLRRAIEGEVAEPDLREVAQARENRFVGELGLTIAFPRTSIGEAGEQIGDRELVELRQRVAAPFPAERLGLEPLSAAIRARIVGAVAREEDTHVHLVGRLFEPAEKPLQPIPILRPLLAVLLAVARFAVDHETLLLGCERGEWDVGRDFLLLREDEQVFFGLAVDFASPSI